MTLGHGDYSAVWLFLLLLGAVAVLVVLLVIGAVVACIKVDREKPAERRCPKCSYDLRATPDRCPECGTVPPEVPTK